MKNYSPECHSLAVVYQKCNDCLWSSKIVCENWVISAHLPIPSKQISHNQDTQCSTGVASPHAVQPFSRPVMMPHSDILIIVIAEVLVCDVSKLAFCSHSTEAYTITISYIANIATAGEMCEL